MSELSYIYCIEEYNVKIGTWRNYTCFIDINDAWLAMIDLRTEAKEGIFYRLLVVDANNNNP